MKGSRKGLLSLLMIFLLIGIIVPMFLNVNIEGMEPGNYPVSVSSPLLYDNYDVKKAIGLSKRNASDNYKLDFQFSICSRDMSPKSPCSGRAICI